MVKVAIEAFIPAICRLYLMAYSNHVSRNQPQGNYTQGLSQLGILPR